MATRTPLVGLPALLFSGEPDEHAEMPATTNAARATIRRMITLIVPDYRVRAAPLDRPQEQVLVARRNHLREPVDQSTRWATFERGDSTGWKVHAVRWAALPVDLELNVVRARSDDYLPRLPSPDLADLLAVEQDSITPQAVALGANPADPQNGGRADDVPRF
jgi:hypothetical protein